MPLLWGGEPEGPGPPRPPAGVHGPQWRRAHCFGASAGLSVGTGSHSGRVPSVLAQATSAGEGHPQGREGAGVGSSASQVQGQAPTDPLIPILRPWISVPGEPPTCVSVTPHTTSSVLVQWQVRAWGPPGSREHHVREAAMVTRDSAGLEPPETQPHAPLRPAQRPRPSRQVSSDPGGSRRSPALGLSASWAGLPLGSPGSPGAQTSTGHSPMTRGHESLGGKGA